MASSVSENPSQRLSGPLLLLSRLGGNISVGPTLQKSESSLELGKPREKQSLKSKSIDISICEVGASDKV